MKTSELLKAARAKFPTKRNWVRHTLAKLESGKPVSYLNKDATRFCARGAVLRASWDAFGDDVFDEDKSLWELEENAIDYLQACVKEYHPRFNTNIEHWNDAAKTKYPEVIMVFDDAIALAEQLGD